MLDITCSSPVQWAMIVLQVERSLSPQQLVRYQRAYSASITFDCPQATTVETANTNMSHGLAPPNLLNVTNADPPGTPILRHRRRSWATQGKDMQ